MSSFGFLSALTTDRAFCGIIFADKFKVLSSTFAALVLLANLTVAQNIVAIGITAIAAFVADQFHTAATFGDASIANIQFAAAVAYATLLGMAGQITLAPPTAYFARTGRLGLGLGKD